MKYSQKKLIENAALMTLFSLFPQYTADDRDGLLILLGVYGENANYYRLYIRSYTIYRRSMYIK